MITSPSHHRLVRDHCLAPSRAVDAPVEGASGKYGRMFPELAPLEADDDLFVRLGARDGPCDGGLELTAEGGEDARVAAGWPLFGQFVAHDITADRSLLLHHGDPEHLANFRSPRANLECLYGAGPGGHPFLYDRGDPAKLLIGLNDAGEPADLPRNRQGVALIGDPRNDVHVFVSQLHVAMCKAHNGLVDRLREDGEPEAELFEAARRAATWHYQWVILNDYLPVVAGAELAAELLERGPRWYRPGDRPEIPLEFADGAFRYGHSQIRRAYRLQDGGPAYPLFPDLLGFRPVPAARRVDWAQLFDLPGRPAPQASKRIDGRLARSLIELPAAITGEVAEAEHSLAVRDLMRGQAYGLPAGEAVARAMGVEPLRPDQTELAALGWEGTPLWYYVLKEAEHRADGDRLGPVGGRIVAEVLLGIVDADPESYRAVDPGWRPTLPSAEPGRFTAGDLLAFAG
ncbi:MAG TPA: heme peroxidase family protein [Actinomycetes bacterium]|nr:heme peroxidase family protein [Actinomycetes bacterium]